MISLISCTIWFRLAAVSFQRVVSADEKSAREIEKLKEREKLNSTNQISNCYDKSLRGKIKLWESRNQTEWNKKMEWRFCRWSDFRKLFEAIDRNSWNRFFFRFADKKWKNFRENPFLLSMMRNEKQFALGPRSGREIEVFSIHRAAKS